MAIQRSTLVTKAQELMNTEWLDYATAARKARDTMNATTPVSATSAWNQMQYEINKQKRQDMANAGTIPAVWTSVTPQGWQTQAPTPPPPVTSSTTPSGATMNADWTVTPATTPVTPTNPVTSGVTWTPNILENPDIKRAMDDIKNWTISSFANDSIEWGRKTTAKTEAPIDYNASQGRETEIQDNIANITAKNPALLKDRNAYNQAFGYETADAWKKAMLDASFNGSQPAQPTANSMYNAIATKADIPDDQKTSLPFKIAQNRYTKASSFSTMTASQLANEMDNSRFIQGSQAYEDVKAMNPKLVQDTENLRIVNGKKQNIFTTINNPDGTPVKVNNLENTFAQDYIDNFGEEIKKLYAVQTPEQIRAIINTPDVIAAQDKATQIELSMNEIEKQIDKVDEEVSKEFEGSWATGSRIALEKAIRKDKLEKEYNSQLKNYTTYANKANNLITQNTTNYTTSQAQKLAQANAMLPILQDQYKTAQAKAEAEAALQDPATAIKSVMDEYKKLGIPFTSTVQSRLAEFKASGKPLEQFLTEMGQNIQDSPSYKQYQAQQAGKWISYETIWDKVYKNTNGVLTETGISATKAPEAKAPEWRQDTNGNWYNANSSTSPAVQASTLSPTSIAQYSTRLQGNNVQCGMVSNDYAKVKFPDAPRMWDTYESKIKTIDAIWQAPIPQVWGLFVMDTWTSTGHTGIVTAVNGDGTFTATDANKSGSKDGWPLQTSTYKISDKVSFSNAPTGTQATPTDTKSTQNLSLYRTYVEDGKLPSKDALKWMNMTSQQFIDNADSGYDAFLKTKAKEISDTYPTLDIEYTWNYAWNSATQKEKLNESVTKIGDIDSRISQLKSLFEKNGTEVWPTADKSVMESLRKQIILKAKEVENLGVLNWPDLGILEDLLPSTTWVMSWLFSFDSNTMAKLNNIQNNYRMDAKTKAINYGAKIDFKWDQPTQSQSNTAPFTMDTLDNEWLNFKP